MKLKVVAMYYDKEQAVDCKTWLILELEDWTILYEASTDPVATYSEIRKE